MPRGNLKSVSKGCSVTGWVIFVIVLLIVTKLFDAYSTLKRIKTIRSETNPMARRMMARTGTRQAVWLIFFFSLIIIILAGATALTGNFTLQWFFIILGILLSIIQAAVAQSNWMGKDNIITAQIRRLYTGFQRLLSKR